MAQGLVARFVSLFDGDAGVRRVADDPVLSAELLLLFRMILADGAVTDGEMAAFRRICTDAFGIPPASVDSVIEYLNETGYETTGAQALAVFRGLDEERRRLLAKHMAEIAKADSALAATEVKLLRRTLEVLDLGAPKAV
ncbi:MAG: TerB family tellurite resistance protein [Rhizobiaceae bacterium]|nr:TerB family tellurite resistance protein [Rhizobiaceae bacterium]